MTSYRDASSKRDDLIDKVELAIMSDRSISGRAANLEIVGGDFYRATAPGSAGPFASIADLGLTRVIDGNLVKVMAWYDNEMGYTYTLVEHVIKSGLSIK